MEIDWIKYGFEESEILKGEFSRDGFPFILGVYNNCLQVWYRDGTDREIVFSTGTIPATNQSVVLLLKAFNVPKNP